MSDVKWGLVSTIKAPPQDILNFAAYHLDLGAHRLFLYLDAPTTPDTFATLKAHPKIRPRLCDSDYWKQVNGWKPKKHQVRQCINATHAYGRASDTNWIAHIDVDEFIFPDQPIESALAALAPTIRSARMKPMEALADAEDLYKTLLPTNALRDRIYPRFGRYLKSGFLSHVAGKVFARTGLRDAEFKIHNLLLSGKIDNDCKTLPDLPLCHRHVTNWPDWQAQFAYRLEKGSYRADLSAAQKDTPTLHQALSELFDKDGEKGLHAFFDETCAATETHCATLQEAGLLRHCPLDLDRRRRKHFPEANPITP